MLRANIVAFSVCASSALAQTVPPSGWASDTSGNCTIRPLQEVEVVAPVGGVIAKVFVEQGQRVQAGDIIAIMDQDLMQAELAIAEHRAADDSAIQIAQTRFDGVLRKVERLRTAYDRNAVALAELDATELELSLAERELAQVRSAYELAILEADRARVSLGKATILSPVTGQVSAGLIDPGEAPRPDQPIAKIVVVDPLRVEAYVPTNQLRDFLDGDTHTAQIEGQNYPLEFDYTSVLADYASSTVSVFFRLASEDVLPGFNCRILPE